MSSVDNSWSWFPNERIVHSVEFESEDLAFAGEMKMTWTSVSSWPRPAAASPPRPETGGRTRRAY
jgi:hypothetical protein